MKISELPVAEKVNNEDVFPVVQDGETKKAPKEALQIPDDVGITDAGNLVLTVSGEKIGEGVPLPKTEVDQTYSPESTNAQSGVAVSEAVKKAGVRKIRHIELGTGETAVALSISTDEDGNPFELSEAFFTAHFVFDPVSGTNAAIRIRADAGQRYLVIKTGVSLSTGIITCSGTINAHGGILSTTATYSTTDSPQAADTMYGMIAKANGITHNLKNIEAFLLVSGQLELKEGSFLELWGC